MKKIRDAVVVGAGPAGCTAAVQLVREGFSPLLIEKDSQIGGLIRHAWRVENFLFFKKPMSGLKIVKLLEDQIKKWRVELVKSEVKAISKTGDGLWLVCADDLEVKARAVIVCAGTIPKMLEIAVPKKIKLRYYPCEVPSGAKKVAIVGGGDAAFDYALSLTERGIEPVILVRKKEPRALKRLQDEAKSRGIKSLLDAKITGVENLERSIKINFQIRGRGKNILTDEVVVAIGRDSADKRIAFGVELIRSDKTGLPCCDGLWLCGDVWRDRIRQMSIAIGDGLAAAMEAAQFLRMRG